MMRAVFLLVFILMMVPTDVLSLEKDYRSELDIHGRVNEVSISPDNRIWLTTALGNTYYTNGIRENWKYGPLQLTKKDEYKWDLSASFDRARFFTEKIGFISGYISKKQYGPQDGIYRTTDGGKSWEYVSYGGNEWIYDAVATPLGEAWMAGSKGVIHYSKDFGQTWEERAGPFGPDGRVRSIFMKDSSHGIVGALHNEMAITQDNCHSWTKIETPLDQKMYEPDKEGNSDNRIEKVVLYRDHIVVNQNGKVFQSSRESLRWKNFDGVNLIDFGIDLKRNILYGITDKLQVVTFDLELKPILLQQSTLYAPPLDIKCQEGNVFILDQNYGVYQISDKDFVFTYPLMDERSTPDLKVRKYGNVFWGLSTFHIYASDDFGLNWYRLGWTHFPIRDFLIRNPEHLIIWDGHGHNMEFASRTGLLSPIKNLENYDVIEMIPTRQAWIAYGGMQYETSYRIEIARSFFPGQFSGSLPQGFVFLSRDRGVTWNCIDKWTEGGVANLFVDKNENMVLYSYLGSIRKLEKKDTMYQAANVLLATEQNRNQVPYVQESYGFYFADEKVGYVNGWTDHIGYACFKTKDGGIAWSKIPDDEFSSGRVIPYAERHIIATPDSLCLLSGSDKTPVFNLKEYDGNSDSRIIDVSLADNSDILVRTSKNEYFLFDARAKVWKKL